MLRNNKAWTSMVDVMKYQVDYKNLQISSSTVYSLHMHAFILLPIYIISSSFQCIVALIPLLLQFNELMKYPKWPGQSKRPIWGSIYIEFFKFVVCSFFCVSSPFFSIRGPEVECILGRAQMVVYNKMQTNPFFSTIAFHNLARGASKSEIETARL